MIKIDVTPLDRYEELYDLIKEFALFHDNAKVITTKDTMLADRDYFHSLSAFDDTTNAMVGYCIYFYSYRTYTGRTLYLEDVFIKNEYRHKGIFHQFLEMIKKEALENKCTKVVWQVSDNNPYAKALYKSIGAWVDIENRNCELFFSEALK